MGIINFLIDLIPFVGGIKMAVESWRKKELGGKEMEKNASRVHGLFGIISFIADCATGAGGSLARGIRAILIVSAKAAGRGSAKRIVLGSAAKIIGRGGTAFEKGYIDRAVSRGARLAKQGSKTKAALEGASSVLKTINTSPVGRTAIRLVEKATENKIKQSADKVSNTLNSRQAIIEMQKMKKQQEQNAE